MAEKLLEQLRESNVLQRNFHLASQPPARRRCICPKRRICQFMSAKTKLAREQKLSPSAAKLRLLKRLHCTTKFEKMAWQGGARLIAGVDEVGRGSLCGPVVAAAVILDPDYRIRGLRDSKLLLAQRREVLAVRIGEHAIGWALAG